MVLLYMVLIIGWVIFVAPLFSSAFLYIGLLLYSLTIYYKIKCYVVEPGIIPRNHPSFQPDEKVVKVKKTQVNDTILNIISGNEKPNLNLLERKDSEERIHPENNSETASNPTSTKRVIHMFSTSQDDPILFEGDKKVRKNRENKVSNDKVSNDRVSNELQQNLQNPSEAFMSNENEEKIPTIFQKRFCNTCNILRPPKTSHCSKCDNCVRNFDHHCFFVGNCVGERNEKAFVLFLIYGSILSILINVTSVIHAIYICFFEENKIVLYMILEYPAIMTCIFVLGGLSLVFLWCRCRNNFFTIVPSAITIISFVTLFYITLYNLKLEKTPNYLNPFPLIILCGSIPLGIFVSVFCQKQLALVSRGLTTKQYESINREAILEMIKFEPTYHLNRNILFSERFKNLNKFFCKNISKSLIEVTDI